MKNDAELRHKGSNFTKRNESLHIQQWIDQCSATRLVCSVNHREREKERETDYKEPI